MEFTDLLQSLTLEQAVEWSQSNEKPLFIDYELLGPADIRWTTARQAAIENRFYRL